MLRELVSTAEVMDELGGVAAVARLTGRTYGAAFNWRGFVRFPSDTFVVMQEALKARGCSAPPSLWGMVPLAAEKVSA
jgi:hypothetical protein